MRYQSRLLVSRDRFRAGLLDIIAGSPVRMTVRQIFYMATVNGLVPKDERGYDAVQQQLVRMRREGLIPYSRIVDNTRRVDHAKGWSSPRAYLDYMADGYFADHWLTQPKRVIVFLEKDALSEIVTSVTRPWQVPVYIARGYGSVTFLRNAAMSLETDKPTTVLLLGDCDPSGKDAQDKVIEEFYEHRPEVEVEFVHVALTQNQVARWGVPTRPTKATDSRSYAWRGDSAELDAVPATDLQRRLERSIKKRIDKAAWDESVTREHQDREAIRHALSNLTLPGRRARP